MTAIHVVLPFLVVAASLVCQAPEKEPGEGAAGKVYEWQSKDGLRYQYFLPKSYDPAKGITLTFVLHGSNLDRRWGFANHKAGVFRKQDLVVCPDGTTSMATAASTRCRARRTSSDCTRCTKS